MASIIFAVIVLVSVVYAQEKAGYCPAPYGSYLGLCPYTCKTDQGCLGSMKCCPSLCGGLNCKFALKDQPTTTTTAAPATDPGDCPGVLYTSTDKCGLLQVATCTRDSQCLGTLKCCSNGCVKTCRKPAAERTGTCPTSTLTCSVKVCAADSDCPFGLKCCANGCKCSIPNA